MPRLFFRAVAMTAVLLPIVATAAQLTLGQALELAVHRSEAARAARAGVASATASAQAAGQLPDPVLGLSLENLPLAGPDRLHTGRDSMTMKRLSLAQAWVPADKRALRSAAAGATVAREAAAASAVTGETRLRTALAYVDAFFASAALELGAERENRAREAASAARARLSAGEGMAPDVLALTRAGGMAADDSAEARQQLEVAAVALARWTGAANGGLSPPHLDATVPEQVFVDRHPDVVLRRHDVEVARQEAAVTASNRRADWTWEVAYAQRSNFSDMLSLGVSIPWHVAPGARQDRETASKLALVDRHEAELAESIRSAQAEYQGLAAEAARLQQRIAAFERDVLAPARQAIAAATAAYGSNRAALWTVFDAHQAELEARRKLLDLRRDLARARVQLNFKPLAAEGSR